MMKQFLTYRKAVSQHHCASKQGMLAVIALLLLTSATMQAQHPAAEQKSSVPSAEEFVPADGFVEVHAKGKNIYSQTVRLYNEDGTLWYEFSLDEGHPLYYKKNPNPEYKPFSPFEKYNTALRLKAVSPNWYEVLVDEANQKTKYAAKSEDFLNPLDFDVYLIYSQQITFDREKTPLHERPGGRLSSFQLLEGDRFRPRAMQGEWLQVEVHRTPKLKERQFGWIRWKKDREILVGFQLNCKECE